MYECVYVYICVLRGVLLCFVIPVLTRMTMWVEALLAEAEGMCVRLALGAVGTPGTQGWLRVRVPGLGQRPVLELSPEKPVSRNGVFCFRRPESRSYRVIPVLGTGLFAVGS